MEIRKKLLEQFFHSIENNEFHLEYNFNMEEISYLKSLGDGCLYMLKEKPIFLKKYEVKLLASYVVNDLGIKRTKAIQKLLS